MVHMFENLCGRRIRPECTCQEICVLILATGIDLESQEQTQLTISVVTTAEGETKVHLNAAFHIFRLNWERCSWYRLYRQRIAQKGVILLAVAFCSCMFEKNANA